MKTERLTKAATTPSEGSLLDEIVPFVEKPLRECTRKEIRYAAEQCLIAAKEAEERHRVILETMLDLGNITKDEFNEEMSKVNRQGLA